MPIGFTLTTKDFIKRAKEKHGDRYDYKLVEYINMTTKIKIICPVHNIFEQAPACHLSNNGCRQCSNLIKNNSQKITLEEFIERSNKMHNFKYDYSKVKFNNCKDKTIIFCPIHKYFEQMVMNHLMGFGCNKCGDEIGKNKQKSNTEEFIMKAKNLHNNFYNYSLVDYKTAKIKIKIICPEHGIFEQTPDGHLAKKGCIICGSSNIFHKSNWIKKAKGREGIVYIIKCWNDDEEFYKIGRTFQSIKERFSRKSAMPYNYEIIREVKSMDLGYIFDLEKRFIKRKINNKYIPLLYFAGITECFK